MLKQHKKIILSQCVKSKFAKVGQKALHQNNVQYGIASLKKKTFTCHPFHHKQVIFRYSGWSHSHYIFLYILETHCESRTAGLQHRQILHFKYISWKWLNILPARLFVTLFSHFHHSLTKGKTRSWTSTETTAQFGPEHAPYHADWTTKKQQHADDIITLLPAPLSTCVCSRA